MTNSQPDDRTEGVQRTKPYELTVSWNGQEHSIAAGEAARIGRDESCDIVVANPHVSRHHADVRPTADGWELIDATSSQGTFVNGRKIKSQTIEGPTEVVLGQPGPGAVLVLKPRSPALPATDTDDAGRQRPGGDLRSDALDDATVVSGDRLAIECGARTYQFDPGPDRIIGRDKSAAVVSSNPTVSRRHAALRHDGLTWILEDLDSSGGTFVDGRRVKQVELKGSTAVWLGDPETGERLVAVASGTRQQTLLGRTQRFTRSGKGMLVLGVIALAALFIGVVAATSGGDSSPAVNQLAQATVNIYAGDFGGSGTIIDAERGLILTNAHVAAPAAMGTGVRDGLAESELPESASSLLIAVTGGLDRAAEVRYRGEVVAVDGLLDLAVVKITSLGSGAIIEPGDLDDLVDVEIGDSDKTATGDRVRVIGYPGIAESDAPTLTQGVVSGSVRDDRIGSNRGYINIDADINPGNSGGATFDDRGRLIGVPTLLSLNFDTISKSNRIRPINLAAPLIEAATTGTSYTSPFFAELTGDEEIVGVSFIQPASTTGFTASCSASASDIRVGDKALSAAINYKGFATGSHQDLMVRVLVVPAAGNPTVIGSVNTNRQYPFTAGATGCVSVTVNLFDAKGNPYAITAGNYAVQVFAGPNYRLLGQVRFGGAGTVGSS